MFLKRKIQELSRAYGIKPTKKFSQNFLWNEEILKKIADAAKITSEDIVLEVGPGFGNLTSLLAQKAKRVIAVELDRKFVDIVRSQLNGFDNVEIIQGDILHLTTYNLQLITGYKIVANLPYSITSHFLRKFLTVEPKPVTLTLLVQKEVAGRICAKPGDMSLLGISVQFYAEPTLVFDVRRENFWPEPKVDSALVFLEVKKDFEIQDILKQHGTDEKSLFRLVKFGFSSRRKQLQNNLASGLSVFLKKKISKELIQALLERLGLNPLARAQDLSVQDWLKIAQEVKKF